MPDTTTEEITCQDRADGKCKGPVEYRMNLTGTGRPTKRCDFHWDKRLQLEEDLNRRYPPNPPTDWDYLDAGEHWYEDY